jgi:cytochrome c
MRPRLLLGVVAVTALAWSAALVAIGSEAQPRGGRPATPAAGAHGEHGTPKGWKFAWPKGDPGRGREAFAKLECYACHEVKGQGFPAPSEKGKVGPELAAMGPLHDAEYFAESIVNPGAVIEKGKGYAAPDGSSKMPSFNDSMTVQEAIDLVAFLKSLKPAAGTAPGHRGH